jgi:hypothetical protein
MNFEIIFQKNKILDKLSRYYNLQNFFPNKIDMPN